jgi:L-asparaginase
MTVKIFTTGGTIDKIYFDDLSRYEVGSPQVGEILTEAKVSFHYEIEEIARKDSLYVTDADRLALHDHILAEPADRLILITHGTDTIVETAMYLRNVPERVVVLTGALIPARFKNSDAAFNVGSAIGALQVLPPGIYIAMGGRVYPADKVRKNREANRFEETL